MEVNTEMEARIRGLELEAARLRTRVEELEVGPSLSIMLCLRYSASILGLCIRYAVSYRGSGSSCARVAHLYTMRTADGSVSQRL